MGRPLAVLLQELTVLLRQIASRLEGIGYSRFRHAPGKTKPAMKLSPYADLGPDEETRELEILNRSTVALLNPHFRKAELHEAPFNKYPEEVGFGELGLLNSEHSQLLRR